ncbi:hypothetical protein [Enterococcus raffinosus]|jgi:hypothetical protein|uniref:hypothetical protein n=1 Tax=Enterococcus raffinosus TaxID=71452 RepID=UPI0028FDAAC2|nr:hypothetical protein NUITMVRE36_08150 [Enterococcus raffinosus]
MTRAFIEHPIKMYIRRDLGITVEQFGKLAGIPQSTLATWIKRERRVEKLPIDFYSALATVRQQKIEVVYGELLKWQQSYDRYKQESLQAIAEEQPLFSLAAEEGRRIYRKYRGRKMESQLLEPARRLRKAIDQLNVQAFIQVMIEIYATVEIPMPTWIVKSFNKSELKEIGQAFYNELLMKG